MDVMGMLRKERIVAIVRGLRPCRILDLADALRAGGISMMEVTFDQSDPESWQDTQRAIVAVAQGRSDGMAVGAGTVMSVAQVRMAYEAGARYVISPNTSAAVIQEAKRLGMCAFPGAFTPTEIAQAYDAGADAVKVFPAGTLGPGYIKALRAPLKHIDLIAVGGINENNAADFIRNGAIGVGVGGNLVNPALVEGGELEKIALLASKYAKAVQELV